MASYSAPTADQIQSWTGLNTSILAQTAEELDTQITELLGYAEAKLALTVTEATFDSTGLTARQVKALQLAAAYLTAALFLASPAVQDATGTEEPLLMSFSDIAEAIAYCERQSGDLAALAANGEGTQVQGIGTSFSSDDERTYTRSMQW